MGSSLPPTLHTPVTISLTQATPSITESTVTASSSTQSFSASSDGISFLDMEVLQTFQCPSGRVGSSYTPSTSTGTTSSSGSSAGLIAGVVVGVLIVVGAIIIIVCCCKRKNKASSSSDQTPSVQIKESQLDEKSPIALNTTYPEPLSQPQSFVNPTPPAPPPQVGHPQPGYNQFNGHQVPAYTPQVQPQPIITPQYHPQPM